MALHPPRDNRHRSVGIASRDKTPLDIMQKNLSFWEQQCEGLVAQLELLLSEQNEPTDAFLRALTEAERNRRKCANDVAKYVHPKFKPAR